MCGKFTTKVSWTDITDYIDRPLDTGDDDPVVRLRVMDDLPVIVRDADERHVMPMRWGFPSTRDWRRPQPIHARAETIDTLPTFAAAFRDGQRGIVLMQTFNEAPDIEGPTRQHIVTPDTAPLAAAVLWRRFDVGGNLMFACVLVTVPANPLLMGLPTDRMPAFLQPDDWTDWLGEDGATPDDAKAVLKTTPGARWTMTPEQRAASTRRAKPTVSDPGGLFD
jgi:putative SOS response-associated peptidase YedK